MLAALRDVMRKQWFLDTKTDPLFINDVAVRIRAGLLLAIPLYMAFTLFDAIYGSRWVITGNVVRDTFDTDFDGRILYMVEAVRRTFDYSTQTYVLWFGLFEMLAAMFAWSSRFSPTIWLASLLAAGQEPVWKPLTPKRFAWSIGATFICICLVFFNPEVFAGWVNWLARSELLPTTRNYMPPWIPLVLVWVCFGFMWLESVLGVCVGCKLHALLVRLGLLQQACDVCDLPGFGNAAGGKPVVNISPGRS
ncbi:MAG: DUF4395 domain-containing protein [Hylemonella sp.]|jgi:hypothetical protein